MNSLADVFNKSWLSRFLNSSAGRIFRILAGMVFLIVGFINRDNMLGIISMAWGIFPLSAGAFDICYISVLLGGPISGEKIRAGRKLPT